MIDLHSWPTPNGKKVTILLEEAGIEYRLVECNIGRGDQFEAGFLGISPNNRMPALIDHKPADGGEPISVFESGAMMMYLAEKEGRFYPRDVRSRYEVNQWLMWQMANQGPAAGCIPPKVRWLSSFPGPVPRLIYRRASSDRRTAPG